MAGGENGEAMEVDTGEEGDDGFGQENGGAGPAGSGMAVAVPNGDAGASRFEDGLLSRTDEIPEGDVAVLNNHHSEVSFELVVYSFFLFTADRHIVGCM